MPPKNQNGGLKWKDLFTNISKNERVVHLITVRRISYLRIGKTKGLDSIS